MKNVVTFVTIVVAGATGLFWYITPKSISALENMTRAERLEYFASIETSAVVDYYCGGHPISSNLEADLAHSMEKEHGAECYPSQ